MLKQQTVTIRVTYDDTQSEAPAIWPWNELQDDDGSKVELIGAGPVVDAP
jgi:hypothetical protein